MDREESREVARTDRGDLRETGRNGSGDSREVSRSREDIVQSSDLLVIAGQMSDIYDDFTTAVRSLGSKDKDKEDGRGSRGKMGQSMAHWFVGGHVRTEREVLCDKFLDDVQKQLEYLHDCFDGASEEEINESSYIVSEIMTRPMPADSDSTTNLMKRAIIGQVIPFFQYLNVEQLTFIEDRLLGAYKRRQLLPVEKDVERELNIQIREKSLS